MITLSNSLSFLRIPLAFFFLTDHVSLRCIAVLLAMITDSIDGYIARRQQSVTKFGAILDPATDKFFVYFAMSVFLLEGRLLLWQAILMISRDISICLYGLVMTLAGKWRQIVLRSLRAGKVVTALQFMVLIGLALQMSFSWVTYSAFAMMGSMALVELFQPPARQRDG